MSKDAKETIVALLVLMAVWCGGYFAGHANGVDDCGNQKVEASHE